LCVSCSGDAVFVSGQWLGRLRLVGQDQTGDDHFFKDFNFDFHGIHCQSPLACSAVDV
jgi:hypothetical protein